MTTLDRFHCNIVEENNAYLIIIGLYPITLQSEDDKLPQVPSSTSITSSLSGTDLVNDISTTDLDRSPVAVVTNGYDSHVRNKENEGITIEKLPPIVTPKSLETPTTTTDSGDRMLCFNINSDDDDDEYDVRLSIKLIYACMHTYYVNNVYIQSRCMYVHTYVCMTIVFGELTLCTYVYVCTMYGYVITEYTIHMYVHVQRE